MPNVLRPFLLLALLAAMAASLTACGGGEDAAEQDVDTLLQETFSGSKEVKSGRLAVNAKLDVQSPGGPASPVSVEIEGPFESQGEGKLPKFDIDLSFEGQGQSLAAGVTSTGDKGFVSFQETDYALSEQVFEQFRKSYEQASKQGAEQKGPSLETLGLDPRKWLTDAKNEGEAKVGDTDTVKITGGVDVAKLLDDVNGALAKAGQLGLQGQGVPSQLTQRQRQQVEKAVKDVDVEIYTGADDKILRRMVVALALDGGSDGSGTLDFDLQLLDLNEGQDIEEPEDTKPFDELLGQLGGLGGLLGGAGGGSGAAGGDSGGSGAANQQQLEEFTKCLEEAGSDQAAAQKCSELIQP